MSVKYVDLGTVCSVGPRDAALSADSPFIPMDAVRVGSRFPAYTEPRGNRGGVRACANDVLFARITPCLENGKVAQLSQEALPSGGSTEFIVVRPGELVDPAYLYHWCLEPGVRDQAKGMMTGTTGRMRLAGKDLARFRIPLPSLHEQRRIVEILEDHLSHLDRGHRYLETALYRAEALRESTLFSTFSFDAPVVPLGEIASWSSGGTPAAGNAAFYEGGEIPWCNSGDLNDGRLASVPKSITQLGLDSSSAKMIEPGAVLVAMYGATIGKLAINDAAMSTNQAIAAAVVRPETVTAEYLFWFLRSQRRALRRSGKGGAQPNISQGVLKAWRIPVPSLAQQRSAVKRSEEADELVRRLRMQLWAAERRELALRRAVLAAAFEGKLTGRHTDAEVIEEIASSSSAERG